MKTEARKPQTATQKFSPADRVLRFRCSERLLHWALAVPFLVCLVSALVLFAYYNPDPTRPYRHVFAATHRIAGLAFIILPLLAILIKWDFRTHLQNIRQAWLWTLQDLKWLLRLGMAAFNKKIRLPEQGKFNAAEKLNFMYLMTSYPLYIISGFLIWETDAAFEPWLAHCVIALMALPLVLGHIYMATINAGSRVGLSGMFSGYVDRSWAKHHYSKWFREHFEADAPDPQVVTEAGSKMKSHPETAPTKDTAKNLRYSSLIKNLHSRQRNPQKLKLRCGELKSKPIQASGKASASITR